jgi:hypothetical protein
MQLSIVNQEKAQLLDTLLNLAKPNVEERAPINKEINPILPKALPWRARQQMLEEEDRIKARKMKEIESEIEKLETEVGL